MHRNEGVKKKIKKGSISVILNKKSPPVGFEPGSGGLVTNGLLGMDRNHISEVTGLRRQFDRQ